MLYINGIAQQIDYEDFQKYQSAFYNLKAALISCGKIDGTNDVSLTIDFKSGNCVYQDKRGIEPGQKTNIFYRNREDAEFSEAKHTAALAALTKFQSLCKEISSKIRARPLEKVAKETLEKDGKDTTKGAISVNVSAGTYTYTLAGQPPQTFDFKPETMPLLDQARRKIGEQEQSIEQFASDADPTHVMGQVPEDLKPLAASELWRSNALKRVCLDRRVDTRNPAAGSKGIARNGMSGKETRARAARVRQDIETLLPKRAEFRMEVLEGYKAHVLTTQDVLKGVLQDLKDKVEADPNTVLTGSQQEFDVSLAKAIVPMARKIRNESQENPKPTLQSVTDNLIVRYKDCVAEINSRVVPGVCSLEESIKETQETIGAGIKKSKFLRGEFEAIVNGSENGPNSSSNMVASTIQTPKEDSFLTHASSFLGYGRKGQNSWKNSWISDLQKRRSEDGVRERLVGPRIATQVDAIVKFESSEILNCLKEINNRIDLEDHSIVHCIDESIEELKSVRDGDRSSLQKELKKGQDRVLDSRISEYEKKPDLQPDEKALLQKLKDYRMLSDVFLGNDINERNCMDYRHLIDAGITPGFLNSLDLDLFRRMGITGALPEARSKKEKWKAFQACFKEAEKQLLSRWSFASEHVRRQALFNAFTLLVPAGCEDQYSAFVLKASQDHSHSYTLPHRWKQVRKITEERKAERNDPVQAASEKAQNIRAGESARNEKFKPHTCTRDPLESLYGVDVVEEGPRRTAKLSHTGALPAILGGGIPDV
jgi:hypothetical protein